MEKELKYDGWLKIFNIKDKTKNGKPVNRELMSRSSGKRSDDSVAGILCDADKEIFYFVNQYRVGASEEDRYLTEIMAGTLEQGENPVECFKREAMEEVGFEIDSISPCGVFYTSPGGTSERIFLFIADGVRTQIGGGLDTENEDIEVVEYTMDDLMSTEFKDLKTAYMVGLIIMSHQS